MKQIILIITTIITLFFLLSSATTAFNYQIYQTPSNTWAHMFGGAGEDQGYSIIQTRDQGYCIIGNTDSYGAGQYDVWMIKLDEQGNHEWDTTFGGSRRDRGYDLKQTTDNGYIITGYTESFGEGLFDVWMIKTDAQGNEQWNRTYGGFDYDLGSAILQTDDDGYIITGYTSSQGPLNCNLWIIKTDAQGNEQWNKVYGGDICEAGFCIQAINQGYVIVGYTESFGAGDYDGWIIVTDHQGNHLWNQTYGGPSTDVIRSVQPTEDQGFLLTGFTMSTGSGQEDIWIMKIDEHGLVKWEKTYGGPLNDRAYQLVKTTDGYVLTGQVTNRVTRSNIILITFDEDGAIIWEQQLGSILQNEVAQSITATTDGGYAIAGWKETNGTSNKDVWVLKTDTQGSIIQQDQHRFVYQRLLQRIMHQWRL